MQEKQAELRCLLTGSTCRFTHALHVLDTACYEFALVEASERLRLRQRLLADLCEANFLLPILAALSSHTKAPLDDSTRPGQPSFDELVETVAGPCECLLTPKAGANLEAGKALMRRKIEEAQAQLTERSNQ